MSFTVGSADVSFGTDDQEGCAQMIVLNIDDEMIHITASKCSDPDDVCYGQDPSKTKDFSISIPFSDVKELKLFLEKSIELIDREIN